MEERHLSALNNAFASYSDIEIMSSPPSNPLQFDEAHMYQARRIGYGTVYDREENVFLVVENIVYRDMGVLPDRAFWIQRKLKKAIYGCVRSCRVLKPYHSGSNHNNISSCDDSNRRQSDQIRNSNQSQDPLSSSSSFPLSPEDIVWELTDDFAAVKICDWDIIRSITGLHREDPLQEISAMQSIQLYTKKMGASTGGTNDEDSSRVLNILDVLYDSNYLFIFMPFCNGGELYTHLENGGRFSEPLARYFFKQILDGGFSLQKTGICHRDISLENILVHDSNIVIIDMGMCLRVPFSSPDGNPNKVVDVASGTLRKLILPQGQCGKPNYIAPEILSSTTAFDGFGVDTWSIGVVLFILLVGLPPWDWATPDDARYRMIALDGRLDEMLRQWGRPISASALDLLQGIFRSNPRDRYTFGQIMDHPWVRSPDVHIPEFLS